MEARFRTLFDQSPLPQVLQTVHGTYAEVNDAFCALLGRDRGELIGRAAASLTHPDDTGEAERVLADVRSGAVQGVQVDQVLLDAAGGPVPVRIDATPLRDEADRPDGCAAAVHDLRPLRASELARTQLRSTFDAVAARLRDFITLYDAQGQNVYASPGGRAMFGDGYADPLKKHGSLVHPDDFDHAQRGWHMALAQHGTHTWRFRVRNPAGEWICVEQTTTNLLDTDAAVVVTIARDVTEHVRATDALQVSEARYRAMAETAQEGIVVISSEGLVTYANARLASILGLVVDDVLGRPAWSVFEGATSNFVAEKLEGRVARGAERYELPYPHPDGTTRALLVAAAPMPLVDGVTQGSLAMISDITEQRRSERELRHAAEHDELTGLLNRTTLMRHLGQTAAEGTAVLFIDLDHFKDVNDGRGHSTGDDVLIEVADRLSTALRSTDVVARFGGDEFVVVLRDADEDVALATARRLLDVVSTAYHVGHQTIRIGASIGIALSPAPSAEDLLRFADTAMYAAKASGRGRARLFDAALAQQAEERFTLGAELQTALDDDVLEMHYQPVVDLVTGEVAGVEALARWQHPTRGPIAPSRFVALAELSASAADLDRWVLRRAMHDIAALTADGTMHESALVGINLSGQSLAEGLDTYIIEMTEEIGLEPQRISLEITESAIMADIDVAIEVLRRLRDHGFAIAIDDFGTGYSSMAYLRDLPITALKIDRGFISGIPEDAHSLAIVASLIELARSLGLQVIAEGVETPAHLEALRSRSCPLAQGWLWSPAVSPAELRESGILARRFDLDPPR